MERKACRVTTGWVLPRTLQAVTADVSIVPEEPAVAATDATSRKRWNILPPGADKTSGDLVAPVADA